MKRPVFLKGCYPNAPSPSPSGGIGVQSVKIQFRNKFWFSRDFWNFCVGIGWFWGINRLTYPASVPQWQKTWSSAIEINFDQNGHFWSFLAIFSHFWAFLSYSKYFKVKMRLSEPHWASQGTLGRVLWHYKEIPWTGFFGVAHIPGGWVMNPNVTL